MGYMLRAKSVICSKVTNLPSKMVSVSIKIELNLVKYMVYFGVYLIFPINTLLYPH